MSKVIIIFYDAVRLLALIASSELTDKIRGIAQQSDVSSGIFVQKNTTVTTVDSNQLNLKCDSLLLLPDSIDNSWDKVLNNIGAQYKILYHTKTIEYDIMRVIINIIKHENCKGYERQIEERNTAYELIGKYCDNNSKLTFDDIWKAIKDVDVILRAKYDFIEQLADTTKTIPPLPSILSNIIVDYKPSSDTNHEKVYNEMLKLLFGE